MNDQSTELAVSDPPAVRALRENLMRQHARFENLLPSIMKPEELFSIAVAAVSKTPKLLECTQESLVKSLTDAARLGLRPDGLLSEGWLIPRYNKRLKRYEASFQTGYRGLEMLMRRAGARKVETRLVYERETFNVTYGFSPNIEHIPRFDIDRSDENVTHAYAWQIQANGEIVFEIMTKAELDAIRDQHGARDFDGKLTGPWISDPGEMRRKTVLRRLAKHSELSTEAKEVLGAEDGESPIEATVEPVAKPAARKKIGTSRLRAKLESKKEPSEQEEAIGEEKAEGVSGEADGSGQEERAADPEPEADQPSVKAEPKKKAAAKPLESTGPAGSPELNELAKGDPDQQAAAKKAEPEIDTFTPDGKPLDEEPVEEGEYAGPSEEEILAITGGEFIDEPISEDEPGAAPEGELEGEVSPGIYIGRVALEAAGEKYDGLLKTYPDGKKRTYFGLKWPAGELLIVAVADVAEQLFRSGKFTLREGQRVKIAGKAYKPTTGAFKGRQLIAVDALETLEL